MPDYPKLPDEEDRIKALHSYHILDTMTEADFDELTELASIICEVPIALISLVDSDRQWFKSHKGLEISETHRRDSFCTHAIAKPNEVFIVENAREDERFKDNPLVTGDLNLTFYAGVPLMTDEGYALGSLCVIDKEKRQMSEAQMRALQIVSRQVMDKLELRRKNTRLEEAQVTNEQLHTQLNETLNELTSSEQSLRLVMESGNLGSWVLNFATNELTVSDIYKRQLGFAPFDELSLTDVFTVVEPAYREYLKKVIEEGIALKRPVVVQYAIRQKETGKRKWIQGTGRVEEDSEGNALRFAGVNTDITDIKEKEEEVQVLNAELHAINDELKGANAKLAEREEILQLALQSATMGTWQIDLQTGSATLSNLEKKLHGFPEEATLSFADALTTVSDEYKQQINDEVTKATISGLPFVVEYKIYVKDSGKPRWLRSTGICSTHETGEPKSVLGTSIDITEQIETSLAITQLNNTLQKSIAKLAEREDVLQVALRSAAMGLWQVDLKENATLMSEQMKRIHAMPPDEDLSFDVAMTTVDEGFRESVNAAVVKSVESGELFSEEYIIHPMDGSPDRWVRSTGVVSTSEDGSRKMLIGTCLDITEQKKDEQRKNDFITMVSHEMKSPLSVVLNSMQIIGMTDTETEPVVQKMADIAIQQVRKMNNLINGFLNVSRIDAGKILLDKTTFAVKPVVQQLAADFGMIHPDYTIRYEACQTLEMTADQEKIGTVLSNFLSNAVKYSAKGSKINIGCYAAKTGGVRMDVTDEGTGIAAADQGKLFDRFYRVAGANMQNIAGYGIGLYLCAEIVKAHGGQIGVESEEGKGSTFWFTVPD